MQTKKYTLPYAGLGRTCADFCKANANHCSQVNLHHCAFVSIQCAAACINIIASSPQNEEECYKKCIDACNACAAECDKHNNDFCKQCAQICREYADACKRWHFKIQVFYPERKLLIA